MSIANSRHFIQSNPALGFAVLNVMTGWPRLASNDRFQPPVIHGNDTNILYGAELFKLHNVGFPTTCPCGVPLGRWIKTY